MISFLVIAALSILLHEVGHVLAGYCCGWRLKRVVVNWQYGGVGVAMEGRDRGNYWKVALAGLAVTALLAVGGILAMPGDYAFQVAALNVTLLVINLLPLRVSDGSHLIRGYRLWRERSI